MGFVRAVTFLYVTTIKNRVLRLVRHPKYLVFALLGVFAVGNRLFFGVVAPLSSRQHGGALAEKATEALSATGLLAVAAGVFLYVAALWVFGGEQASLQFTEAEVRFLFSAPVSRASLLRYKIAQTLAGSLFGALVLTVLGGRGRHPAFFAVGFFLALVTLSLHRIGASFARTSLAGRGTPARRRRAVTLGVAATIAGGFVIAFVTTASTLPRLDGDPRLWLETLDSWPNQHAATLAWALLPLTAPARVMFATSLGEFARALPAALLLVVAHYAWVMSSVVEFEEASANASEKRARDTERVRSRKTVTRAGKRFFALSPVGPPWVALVWKNLAASGVSPRTAVVMVAIVAVSLLAASLQQPWTFAVGAPLAGVSLLVAVFGPVGVRSDIRADLDNLDLLRSYPLAARDVVKGALVAPLCTLTAWTWCLLASGASLCLGKLHGEQLATLVFAGCGAALFLPTLTAFGLLVQNVLAISFPALTTTDTSARGLEASGQRMVALVVMLLVLGATLLPAGLVTALITLFAYGTLGAATWLLGGAAAALVVVAESWVALGVAAKAFERLDVTERAG